MFESLTTHDTHVIVATSGAWALVLAIQEFARAWRGNRADDEWGAYIAGEREHWRETESKLTRQRDRAETAEAILGRALREFRAGALLVLQNFPTDAYRTLAADSSERARAQAAAGEPFNPDDHRVWESAQHAAH